MQNYQNLKYFFLIFFILSYIIGFFLRENITKVSKQDFLSFTWPAILSFKMIFIFRLKIMGLLEKAVYRYFTSLTHI